MGNYNPHAPYIIGNEWVPIRDAAYQPDQVTERGYSFRLDHTAAAVSGAYYVKEPPPKTVTNIAELIYVYPAGQEDKTGPIRRVVIPVSSVGVTGFGGLASGDAASLANPSDNLNVTLDTIGGAGTPLAELNFSVENYSQQLFGKRILGVRLAYTAGASTVDTANAVSIGIGQAFDLLGIRSVYQTFIEGPISGQSPLTLVTDLKYVDFSDTNILPTSPMDSNGEVSLLALPWRYQELALFSPAQLPGVRRSIFLDLTSALIGGFVHFGYAALEVFYCEETRIRYGGYVSNANVGFGGIPPNAVNAGANFVQLKDVNFNVPSALPAGEYVITHVHRELKPSFVARAAPTLHALRQLYELPSHRGVQVDARVVEDAEFSVETIDELTPLTLHTATAIVTGTHPYGTRIGAPVYGTITATQEIEDDAVINGPRTYPQVRFYARRFGDTVVPLTLTDVATGLSTVSITVAEFDALPEIVDGWREVTLRFTTVPSFTPAAGDVDWRWTATSESAINQWQVLGADGPSASGSQTSGPATYYAPEGANVLLNWQSPSISGVADDSISDAVLIFSEDPPGVTGFAVETFSQAVTGVAQACLTDPRCVPTAIQGNRLTWTAFGVCDPFNRVNVDTWNNAPTGQTWTNVGGAATDYAVNGDAGTHTLTNVNTSRNSIVPASHPDQHVEALGLSFSQAATGNAMEAGVILRHVDTSNRYFIEIHVNTNNTVTLHIHSQVAGTISDLATLALSNATHYAGASYNVIGEVVGTTLRARAWQVGKPEVTTWQLTVSDSALSAAGSYGVRARRTAGNTNTNPVVSYDSFRAFTASLASTRLEIQREDDYTDWQTIAETTTAEVCVTSFDDYEARVGVESRYRIRVVNALDFAGSWSTASGTVPSPGVTINGDGNSVLIFTSNAQPNSNLAYVMQWDGEPVETFAFPEADTVQLQRMFGRNFFVAFHPLERGGEQFTRTLLVNAAAISLPSLANFHGLRDLAWADLDYVCVRDELGNRWFANVRVPDGAVRHNRTIYLAQIQVTEVADTASPVDPEGVI